MSNLTVNPYAPPGVDPTQTPNTVGGAVNQQDADDFSAYMSTSPDFKTQFDSLTPAEQQQIRRDFAPFKQATDDALNASEVLNQAVVAYQNLPAEQTLKDLNASFADFSTKAKNATTTGLAFAETLASMNPALPKSLPDLGQALRPLVQMAGSQDQIDRLDALFGIPS